MGSQRVELDLAIEQEHNINMCVCVCIQSNQDLVYHTRKSTQYSAMTYMGKESYKERIELCVQVTHFAVQQKLTQNVNRLHNENQF